MATGAIRVFPVLGKLLPDGQILGRGILVERRDIVGGRWRKVPRTEGLRSSSLVAAESAEAPLSVILLLAKSGAFISRPATWRRGIPT